mgnify:CR=1 FL=1
MGTRLELQNLLENIIESRNVYYQPPESVKINYPAIVYSREDIDNVFADDIVYTQNHTYQLTVIDPNPDSEIVNKISKLPMCRFNRHFKSDNLNHDVFILNY